MKATKTMTEIMRARSPGFLGSEFNDFLFAPICAERNGCYLSVVSALARLDLDPWAEAAQLAKLPVEIATQKLSALLQEVPLARHEPGKIAARLVALLPRGLNSKIRPNVSSSGFKAMTNSRSALSIFLLVFALTLAVQVVTHSIQPPVAHTASSALTSNNSAKVPAPPD
jgi:hypothetical protein